MEQSSPGEAPSPSPVTPGHTAAFAGLHSAELPCQTCGQRTRHRVLRVAKVRQRPDGRELEGVARCSQCRWTHPFALFVPAGIRIPAVLSDGARSRRTVVEVDSDQRLQVGSRIPDQSPPVRILRIDRQGGAQVSDAIARDVETVWLAPDVPRPIPVSLVLGSRTATTRATLAPDRALAVGETIEVAGATLRIVGLRARNRTWTHDGDRFTAREVSRIYTRRTDTPPAGSRRWTRSRDMPRSRETSASRPVRSRSGPGVRMRRSRPRARTAATGAVVHRDSPS